MLVESKKTGRIIELTLEGWQNLENTGHAKNFKILDSGIVPKAEKIVFAKPFGKEPITLDVEYHLNYRELLDKAGIKYSKNIKSQEKLKEIWEGSKDK